HGPAGDGARARRGALADHDRRAGRARARRAGLGPARLGGAELHADLLRAAQRPGVGRGLCAAARRRERRPAGLSGAAADDRRRAAEAMSMRWLAQTLAVTEV